MLLLLQLLLLLELELEFCYAIMSCCASVENSSLYRAGKMYCGFSCLNELNDSICNVDSSLKKCCKHIESVKLHVFNEHWLVSHLNAGILLSNVSITVTSPFNGA